MRNVLSTNLDFGTKTPDALHPPVVDIRYGQIGIVQLRIRTTDTGAILDELTGRIATAPNFFRRTAVSLDFTDVEGKPGVGEIKGVIEAVRRAGMLSVGLAPGFADAEAVAGALNLPVLTGFRPASYPGAAAQAAQAAQEAAHTAQASPAAVVAQSVPTAASPAAGAQAATAASTAARGVAAARETAAQADAEPEFEPAPPAHAGGLPALIQQHTVRSGQRVYARHRDLVVTASVGAGAEVMADGCVHIYGSLRGRAMGGLHGQQTARVFCQEFHAELVSIAGVFRVFETLPVELAGKPVQAWLDGEDLRFAVVGG